MSGRGDSEISETREDEPTEVLEHDEHTEVLEADEHTEVLEADEQTCVPEDDEHTEDPEDTEDPAQVARRARWTAAVTGALLALAGLSASVLRATGSAPAPALVPAAYAFGAAVCALAAFLGSRGRTRRALWLLVAGVMVMALGDQFD
ncbi:hypothetical protein ACIBAG_29260 [Streptomyces sp. NPDC051243]|uniref:hypothetical protein n=1 Tax=Streptomyces sp. NPDC051243 TaxID=3365646 RepID=UPI003797D56D